ncbi:MAG: hypothetical protein QXL85_07775 [Candidatus Bathyarchaeia archaeon]
MPFKVKAVLVSFLGDEQKYPCQFGHKIGDEVIFDGEKIIGRICPDALEIIVPKAMALRYAGPRYRAPLYYAPFWYAGVSKRDSSMKKYDGLGFKPIKEPVEEPKYHMANLLDPNAFKYPYPKERIVIKDVTAMCPDTRTAALFKLEAFDLSDTGYDIPYFRRQMVLLDKISRKSGIKLDKLLDEFTTFEKEDIHPPLNPIVLEVLVEELELLNYLEIRNQQVYITRKGEEKLKSFKASLSKEEKAALFG